jgi:NhaA family Na+:H+ antiporter
LELKREILVGELAELRNAALPIGAAIGGMVVPALIYFAINPGGDAARGWGIPIATDIAFAIGALAWLAGRVPKGLRTFLVALAIVYDLGAVMVIAVFYTDSISLGPLAAAGGWFVLLLVFNQSGIRRNMPYFIVAVLFVVRLAAMRCAYHAGGYSGCFNRAGCAQIQPGAFQ